MKHRTRLRDTSRSHEKIQEWMVRVEIRLHSLTMAMDSTLRRESAMSQSSTWEADASSTWQANRETLGPA
jgi:hypothetical protein